MDLPNVVIPPNLEVIDAGMVTLDKMAARLGFAPGRVVDGMRKRNQLKGVTVSYGDSYMFRPTGSMLGLYVDFVEPETEESND